MGSMATRRTRWLLAAVGGPLASAVLFMAACGADEETVPGTASTGTTSELGGSGGTASSGGGGTHSGGAATGGSGGSTPTERFPLTLTPGERFLREASGAPFFFHGDTGWSLVAQLTPTEAEQYLDDRQDKGFTVILVNLLEHEFADQAPANAAGEAPFTTAGDYATVNEAYFAHVDWILDEAEARGLLVLLTPSYLGWGGGSEGFYQEMVANGPTKLEAYGRFLGARYASQPNIMWLHAGDYDPPDPSLVHAIVDGIRAEDSVHLHSAHTARGEAASDVWGAAEWLDVDNVYTDDHPLAPSLALYGSTTRPFFLIEGYYEGAHDMTEQGIRHQAYAPLLAGAMGQIFGNNPIWCFGSSTCLGSTSPPTTWQQALDARGSRDMAVLGELFATVPWERFAPAADLIVADDTNAIAALADDGRHALVYTQALGSVEVDLSALAAAVHLDRIDPTSGTAVTLTSSPLDPSGSHAVDLDAPNATGTNDWVLRFRP